MSYALVNTSERKKWMKRHEGPNELRKLTKKTNEAPKNKKNRNIHMLSFAGIKFILILIIVVFFFSLAIILDKLKWLGKENK